MTERVTLEPGYVLHRRAFRDTSVIVELHTEHRGRVAVVARGVQRPRSPWRALLEPLRPLLLSWSGRGELPTLTGVEANGAAPLLAGSVLLSGLYLNELLLRLTERGDPHPELYAAYAQALAALAQCATAPDANQAEQKALRIFERRLLDAIGYGLALEREATSGAPISAERAYNYELERGPIPILTVNGGRGSLHVSGRTLLAVAHEQYDDAVVLREAKVLLRAVLDGCIGNRPLQSRQLRKAYEHVKRHSDPGE